MTGLCPFVACPPIEASFVVTTSMHVVRLNNIAFFILCNSYPYSRSDLLFYVQAAIRCFLSRLEAINLINRTVHCLASIRLSLPFLSWVISSLSQSDGVPYLSHSFNVDRFTVNVETVQFPVIRLPAFDLRSLFLSGYDWWGR